MSTLPCSAADQVGQFVVSEERRKTGPSSGSSSSGRPCFGVAVDGAGRALFPVAAAGVELHPGADGADVGLFEELRVRAA